METNAPELLSSHPGRKLFLAGGFENGEEPKSIGLAGVQEAVDFYSTHEEAETRMILHALHASNVFERNDMTGRVIIKTPDTDVLVLAFHYYPQMDRVKEFWIETGTVTRTTDLRRFIPVHDICHSQSSLFLKVLPAIHALTGCDSTSGFFQYRKKFCV